MERVTHYFTFGSAHRTNFPTPLGAPLENFYVAVELPQDCFLSHREVFIKYFMTPYCPRAGQFSHEYDENSFQLNMYPLGCLLRINEFGYMKDPHRGLGRTSQAIHKALETIQSQQKNVVYLISENKMAAGFINTAAGILPPYEITRSHNLMTYKVGEGTNFLRFVGVDTHTENLMRYDAIFMLDHAAYFTASQPQIQSWSNFLTTRTTL